MELSYWPSLLQYCSLFLQAARKWTIYFEKALLHFSFNNWLIFCSHAGHGGATMYYAAQYYNEHTWHTSGHSNINFSCNKTLLGGSPFHSGWNCSRGKTPRIVSTFDEVAFPVIYIHTHFYLNRMRMMRIRSFFWKHSLQFIFQMRCFVVPWIVTFKNSHHFITTHY